MTKHSFKIVALLLYIILLTLSNCKREKKGIEDHKWRQESQKIASDICRRFQKCAENIVKKIEPSLRDYTKSSLRPENCSEKNEKSRVYLLKGYEAEFIKKHTRKCHAAILEMTCQEINNGSIQKAKNCIIMKKIQSGERVSY